MSRFREGLDTLLLDAGNCIIYLDHAALGALTGLDPEVLADKEGVAKRVYEEFLSKHADHDPAWEILMKALLSEAGSKAVDADYAIVLEAHTEKNLWRRVPPELPDALRRIRAAGWKTGVVSNSEGRLIDILREVQVADLFDTIVDSGVEGVSKPDPRIFELALARLGSSAERAIYAGDVPNVDVVGARAAGVEAVLIDTLEHYPEYADAPRYRTTAELIGDLLSPS